MVERDALDRVGRARGEFLARARVRLASPGTGSYDALAVAGSTVTVWRLTQRAWAKVQLITVPIQYGSSG